MMIQFSGGKNRRTVYRKRMEEGVFRTELCDLLSIEYPIIQGGMVWVSYSELCAAVSEAGAFGILAGASMTANESSPPA